MSYQHISTFSGIGAFDLAFERYGVKSEVQVEYDKYARRVLAHQFPHADRSNTDVTTYKPRNTTNPANLVVTGGFPCQDISPAGSGHGLHGDRSGLFFEFTRIVREARPAWVVFENHHRLLTGHGGRDMLAVVKEFQDMGYSLGWRVVDSRRLGTPQIRRRVFGVAHLGDATRLAKVLSLEESDGWHPPAHIQERFPSAPVDETWLREARRVARAQSFYQWVDDGRLATLKARDHRDQPNVVLDEMATSVWEARSFDGVPRIRKDMLVPTINTSQGGQRVPLVGMRYMTELELERAQGFPDGWTDVGNSKTQRIKQLGNSIYYPIADLIAYQITRYWNR